MSHAYSQITIHLVFSTKDRRKLIGKHHQLLLWSYLAGICQKDGIFVHAIGGTEDHIHLLIQIPPSLPLAKAVNVLKSSSSKWASVKGFSFAWQDGYAAFSVSASNIPAVLRYIETQEAHHRKLTFDEEFLALLKKHNVEFDMKFVLG